MSTIESDAAHTGLPSARDALAQSRFEKRLPTLLSVIAGMVDLTSFLTLGNLFTAHITGNLVVVAALSVRQGMINPAQILAILVFILAVAGVWLLARISSKRGPGLLRPLLLVQFLLLICVLIFELDYQAIREPSRFDGQHRRHDGRLRYGVSVRSLALGFARRAFNCCHDRKSDKRGVVAGGHDFAKTVAAGGRRRAIKRLGHSLDGILRRIY